MDLLETVEERIRPRFAEPLHAYTANATNFFECLNFSYAYSLAIKEATIGLGKDEISSLPKDFDEVRSCYRRFGDVSKENFRSWWMKYGRHYISTKYSTPFVRTLWTFDTDASADADPEALDIIAEAIKVYRSKIEGNLKAVVLYIPTCLTRADIHRQIDDIFEDFEIGYEDKPQRPEFQFIGNKKFSSKQFLKMSNLIKAKCANPAMPNWKLGAITKFSNKLSGEVGLENTSNLTEILRINRELLGKVVSRAFKKYERIIENAARGRFPDDSEVDLGKFSYEDLKRRYDEKNEWRKDNMQAKFNENLELSEKNKIYLTSR